MKPKLMQINKYRKHQQTTIHISRLVKHASIYVNLLDSKLTSSLRSPDENRVDDIK